MLLLTVSVWFDATAQLFAVNVAPPLMVTPVPVVFSAIMQGIPFALFLTSR